MPLSVCDGSCSVSEVCCSSPFVEVLEISCRSITILADMAVLQLFGITFSVCCLIF